MMLVTESNDHIAKHPAVERQGGTKHRMLRRHFLSTLGSGLLVGGSSPAATASLTSQLEAVRSKHSLPALGAARFNLDGLTHEAATGFRKAGGTRPVTTRDIWHLGSMTKAMTASLLATYVAEKRLDWDDDLEKLIPHACRGAAPAAARITLRQLLQHRSGLPANLRSWWGLPRADQRGEILSLAAPSAAKLPPAGTFLYSNAGYAIAGHIAESLFAAWIAPGKGFGVIAATNQGGPAGGTACDAACSLLIREFP